MNIGSRVKFAKKMCETETEVPLGSIGILCNVTDTAFSTIKDEELTHYVVFNSISKSDWFNVNELECLGDY